MAATRPARSWPATPASSRASRDAQQSDEEFNATLDQAIANIAKASAT
jgi:hypothetical protein